MAPPAKIHIEQATLPPPTLFLACELGQNKWQLGFTIGGAPQPRERLSPSGDVERLPQESARAKPRFGLPAAGRVVRCYEAGRDGCWLHRALGAHGVQNPGSDAASLAVQRHQRRAKPARLAVRQLLTMLRRHSAGEQKGWSVGRVPSVAEADRRQLHRALPTATQDRTRVSNRLTGW
jgi:transposase